MQLIDLFCLQCFPTGREETVMDFNYSAIINFDVLLS